MFAGSDVGEGNLTFLMNQMINNEGGPRHLRGDGAEKQVRLQHTATQIALHLDNGHTNNARKLIQDELKDINELLLTAADWGMKKVVRLLLERDETNVNFAGSEDHSTALSIASSGISQSQGHADLVELLLKRNDIEVNTPLNIPLHNSVMGGNFKITEMLLNDPRVNVNIATHNLGITALLLAAQNGRTKVVEVLLNQANININPFTTDEWTPLSMAIRLGHTETARFLINRKDVSVNFLGKKETSKAPIHVAIMYENPEVMKLLLQRDDIDVNIRLPSDPAISLEGELFKSATPLYHACTRGYTEMVRLLLSHKGVDVNATSLEGVTPLMVASCDPPW